MQSEHKERRAYLIDVLNTALARDWLSKSSMQDLIDFLERDVRWQEEAMEALLMCGAYRDELEFNPKAAIKALIAQEVDMALDPLISERAAKLLSANPPTVPAENQNHRSQNRANYTTELLNRKIPFTSHNGGAHLIVEGPEGYIDFWPGTGRWNNRKGRADFGIQTLLKYIKGVTL